MERWQGRGYRFFEEGNDGVAVWKGRGAAGWWDPNGVGLSCQAAYQARNAPDYATSLTDLTGNGNLLVEGNGAVPWNPAQGWVFVAAAVQWLDTGLIPANDQSWSIFIQYANVANAAANPWPAAVRTGNNRVFGFRLQAARADYFNGGGVSVGPQLLTGNLGIAGNQGYRNGILDGVIPAGVGVINHSFYIGCRNNVGVAANFITSDVYAVAIYDAAPAAVQAEAAAIAAAMAAL